MAYLNDYDGGGKGVQVDEGIGDAAYEKIEEKTKEAAEDAAKQGAKMAGKGVDKLTDKIDPIKKAKDFVKDKISAVNQFKKKVKDGVKNTAKKGLKGVGKLAKKGVKKLAGFAARHPLAAAIIFIIIVLIMMSLDIDTSSLDGLQSDNSSTTSSDLLVNEQGEVDSNYIVVLMDDCVTQTYESVTDTPLDSETIERAEPVYSVFSAYGLNNASMAGMLACLEKESSIDPSSIEGIFGETGSLGSKKAQAMMDLTYYTEHTLFPKYKNSGISINKDGYKVTNDRNEVVYYCGIGLAQWTGPATYTFLQTANTLGYDWYSLDFQLAYMSGDNKYRSGFFAGWLDDQYEGIERVYEHDEDVTDENGDLVYNDDGTVKTVHIEDNYEEWLESWKEAARKSARKFATGYEGNSSESYITEREDLAEKWFEEVLQTWDESHIDDDYNSGIVDLASELNSVADYIDLEKVNYRCLNGNIFDNSSIANAAISFAWPTRDLSVNNDGTALYKVVHDGVLPGDKIYKACDRCVAMAVKWSGSDDQFPTGTSTQLSHMASSSKWEFVGYSDDVSIGDLSPGDIFVLSGHTFIYTGTELIQAAYSGEASASSDSVSASLGERSAGCDGSTTGILNRGGQDWEGRGVYSIFRCVDPDNSTTYSSIGTGAVTE